MSLSLCPVTFAEACQFVRAHHRHHIAPVGHKFSTGVAEWSPERPCSRLVGVAMVGRPVARYLDDGLTLEVNRTCTDGTENVNSMLYAAAWRATKALGYRRLHWHRNPAHHCELRVGAWSPNVSPDQAGTRLDARASTPLSMAFNAHSGRQSEHHPMFRRRGVRAGSRPEIC